MRNPPPNSVFNLGNWAGEGLSQYFDHYLLHYRELELFQRENTLRSVMRIQNLNQLFRKVSVACLLNDVTQIVPASVQQSQLKMLSPEAFEKIFGSQQLNYRIPNTLIGKNEISEENLRHMSPAFIFPSGDGMERLLSEVAPLIKIGKVFVSPDRILVAQSSRPHPKGPQNKMWVGLSVSDQELGATWTVADEIPRAFTPMVSDVGSIEIADDIATITVPYLTGLDFATFAQILSDEGDHLISFRGGMKKLLTEARSQSKDIDEISQDIIRPAVEKIDRRMRQIASSRNGRLAGWAIASASITLSATLTYGLTAGVLAFGTSGFAAKELADWKDKRDAEAESDFYLLWRLGGAKRRHPTYR